ncbi:MAG TPA: ATP-binding protein [Acidimicrobiales bacterium]|nr:ATP-binding protein [Acidimicrobiales bacterium]
MARGTLRVYLGAAPGVGKTYAMLNEGWRRKERGTDAVVGYLEAHGRVHTLEQVRDLEIVPRRNLVYRGHPFEEMDLDAVLARRPEVVLVDELAHTNVPGSRHEKRWQDVQELLDAGITVISTLNIQHLESLNDVVAQITGITQQETIPDEIARLADQIELVDQTPEALRRRMAHGNIYAPEKVDAALANYFREGNLAALRELALLWLADRVDEGLEDYRQRHGIDTPWETRERVVVALTGAPSADRLLRRGARMAARLHGELIGVHVRTNSGLAGEERADLEAQRRLLASLGGRYAEVSATDVAEGLVDFAAAENATQLLLGATARSKWSELTGGSVINRVIRRAGPVDIHILAHHGDERPAGRALPRLPGRHRLAAFPVHRRQAAWAMATAGVVLLALALSPFRDSLGFAGALLFLLLGVTAVSVVGGVPPAAVAVVVAALCADFFFTVPYHRFTVASWIDVVDLAAFAAAAVAVSILVDGLARRTLQATRSGAEAEALARLAGGAVLTGAEPLPELVDEVRRTFGLDAVAVLAPVEGGWKAVAAAGAPVPSEPRAAPMTAELSGGAVLVVVGDALDAEDRRLLNAFVAQLRLAQERARLQAEADSAADLAEANELRSALLAAVSHDLRTPLHAIKTAATSLLSRDVTWDAEEARGFAKTIDDEADRLTHLVSNLLDMSRIQTGALGVIMRAVAVEDVVYSAVGSLGSASGGVVIDIEGELPLVRADAGLLERALANVVDNALAWSPPGTAVRVGAEVLADRVLVRVVDHGPGIPPDRRQDVFQAFQRLGDRAGASPNGVGLGLAVARGFADAIGAGVAIEDTQGGGTTVVFSLQRADVR